MCGQRPRLGTVLWLLKQDAVECRPPLGPRQLPVRPQRHGQRWTCPGPLTRAEKTHRHTGARSPRAAVDPRTRGCAPADGVKIAQPAASAVAMLHAVDHAVVSIATYPHHRVGIRTIRRQPQPTPSAGDVPTTAQQPSLSAYCHGPRPHRGASSITLGTTVCVPSARSTRPWRGVRSP
jgi:hypothetical protein